jgi:hypothetical protein
MHYCNDKFFELSGHARVPFEEIDWTKIVCPEDMDTVLAAWDVILKEKRPEITQFRINETYINDDGVRTPIWVQATSSPELDGNGNIQSKCHYSLFLQGKPHRSLWKAYSSLLNYS